MLQLLIENTKDFSPIHLFIPKTNNTKKFYHNNVLFTKWHLEPCPK